MSLSGNLTDEEEEEEESVLHDPVVFTDGFTVQIRSKTAAQVETVTRNHDQGFRTSRPGDLRRMRFSLTHTHHRTPEAELYKKKDYYYYEGFYLQVLAPVNVGGGGLRGPFS